MELRNLRIKGWSYFKKLYFKAFPAIERKPLAMLRFHQLQGKSQLHLIYESSKKEYVGLVTVVTFQDIVLVDYLAIDEKCRGLGYGSEVLELLDKKYADKRIVLEIEEIDEKAENIEQRKKRKAFYLKNGFEECRTNVYIFGNRFELLSMHGKVSYAEYEALIFKLLTKKLALKSELHELTDKE